MNGLFIQAMNIHSGGAASLLKALLYAIPANHNTVLIVDERMVIPNDLPCSLSVHRIRPTILGRLFAERRLAKMTTASDIVLCFGNLPPLKKLNSFVVTFIHNRLLVDKVRLKSFPIKTQLRLRIERLWLKFLLDNSDIFIVQTPSMQDLLHENIGVLKNLIYIIPFSHPISKIHESNSPNNLTQPIDFIYPASGEHYKNHKNLILAWIILAEIKLFPTLCLTIDELLYPDLCKFIESKTHKHKLKIFNAGNLSQDEILIRYKQSKALIYPSLIESLGLPLLEAHKMGLPIIASELDYVRDVAEPIQSFDPQSPMSIARAVRRFTGDTEIPTSISSADKMLGSIFSSAFDRNKD